MAVLLVSLVNELCVPVRPHRAGLSEAKNDEVFEQANVRRDVAELDEDVMVFEELGVLRPDEPVK